MASELAGALAGDSLLCSCVLFTLTVPLSPVNLMLGGGAENG